MIGGGTNSGNHSIIKITLSAAMLDADPLSDLPDAIRHLLFSHSHTAQHYHSLISMFAMSGVLLYGTLSAFRISM